VTLSIEEILRATGGTLLQGDPNVYFKGISTDSRTVREGELFFALKGVRFDGHRFAQEALEKKAAGVVIEEERKGDVRWNGYRSKVVILVKDTLRALGDLARERRRRFGTPLVALTGSNGKTTTKEMIAACLETLFPVLKTEGNFNNLIGLPLTLLRLTERERVVVVEMGMNTPGEIRRLTEIAEPDVGLITNIERVHLEGLGSIERVKEEKGALFRLMKKDGAILVNQDDPGVVDLAKDFSGQKITYGILNPADVRGGEIRLERAGRTSFLLSFGGEQTRIDLPLLGRHFVYNALAALATATLFGIEIKVAKEALEGFQPFPMRMEICPLSDGKVVLNDAYNANPKSMELALATLAEVKGEGRGIAVLGDMLELGAYSEEAHRELGRTVASLSIDGLVAIGKEARRVVDSAIRHGLEPDRAWVAESHGEAVSILQEILRKGDWVLVKGSRGMEMEKIVIGLKEAEV
jgi:UDP-N-acetylmuramoyl-tripeptide--D-alanyl-D-alanine ligase